MMYLKYMTRKYVLSKGTKFSGKVSATPILTERYLEIWGQKMCKVEICSFAWSSTFRLKVVWATFIFGWNALRKQTFLRELLICCLFQLAWPSCDSSVFNFFWRVLRFRTLASPYESSQFQPLDSSEKPTLCETNKMMMVTVIIFVGGSGRLSCLYYEVP